MSKYQKFVERKKLNSLAELCYDNEIDPSDLLEQTMRMIEDGTINDESLQLELMQSVGQFVGKMANAGQNGMINMAKNALTGTKNFAGGMVQGYKQARSANQPQANAAQTPVDPAARQAAIKNLTVQLQQLSQSLPQIAQQLQSL